MEAKHTPGPWIQQQYGKPANPYIIAQTCAYPSPTTTVAWGDPTGGQGWPSVGDAGVFDRDTVEANARLIAAAPDLLEACLAVMKDWHDGMAEVREIGETQSATANTLTCGVITKLNAAIAKATGN